MDLEIKDLSLSLQKKEILKKVNLCVKSGEFLSLLGASGSGKTTLLKAIAGIIEPDKGRVFIGDKDITDLKTYLRKTVIVFQDFRLFPHMNVWQNISFALKIKGLSKEDSLAIASDLLKKVQLSGYEYRRIDEISGGQMQRVALARALAAEPDVLLLDEAFSSLDPSLRTDMRTLLKSLQREYSITTLFVTHDKQEALQISDRIAFIKDGEIVQIDSPQNIYLKPNSLAVAEFFSPSPVLRGFVENGVFIAGNIEIQVNLEAGTYFCQLRQNACVPFVDALGAYTAINIKYLGHGYTVSLRHVHLGVCVDVYFENTDNVKLGDRYSIQYLAEKLVFIRIN